MSSEYVYIFAIVSLINYFTNTSSSESQIIFQIEEKNLSYKEKKKINDVLNLRLDNLDLGKFKSQLLFGKDRIHVSLPDNSNLDNIIKLLQQKGILSIYLDKDNVYDEQKNDENLIKLFQKTDLTNISFEEVEFNFDEITNQPVINIKFNKTDTIKFSELTKKNIGIRSHIVLDNKIIFSSIINQQITNGQAQISGSFTAKEAKELSLLLKSGSILYNLSVYKKE